MTTPTTTPTPGALPAAASPSDVLTAPEVAARLGISIRRAYAMIQRGYLPRVKMGRRAVRVPRAAFERWLSAQDAAPEAAPGPEAGAEMFARIKAEETGRRVLALLEGLEEREADAMAACLSYFANAAPRR